MLQDEKTGGGYPAQASSQTLATLFALVQQGRGLTDEALAQQLGCGVPELQLLAQEPRPDTSQPLAQLRAAVEALAAKAGANAMVLIRIIRSGESIEDLRCHSGPAYLLGVHYKDS